MAQLAEVLKFPVVEGYVESPVTRTRTKGDGRAIAVAKFRELADKLESGELDGARVQWLDTHGCLVERVLPDGTVKQVKILDDQNRHDCDTAISSIEYLTRTAWTETGEGTVALRCVTIEEK